MEIKSLMYCYRLLTFCNMCDDSDEFVFPCFNDFAYTSFLYTPFSSEAKESRFSLK